MLMIGAGTVHYHVVYISHALFAGLQGFRIWLFTVTVHAFQQAVSPVTFLQPSPGGNNEQPLNHVQNEGD